MQKFHPIIEKLRFHIGPSQDLLEESDAVLRTELEKMAKELGRFGWELNGVRRILGLSTESEPENETAGWCEEHQKHCTHKTKTAEVWCEKKYCSCCGNKLT
jgi:hypothetical protein